MFKEALHDEVERPFLFYLLFLVGSFPVQLPSKANFGQIRAFPMLVMIIRFCETEIKFG